MDRKKLDVFCERGILGLVLLILVFAPLATGAVRTLEFLIVQWLSICVMVLWGVRLWCVPRTILFWPPISWVAIAFASYAIMQYFSADVEYLARKELIRVLVFVFLFLAILNNLNRQESAQIITFTMIFLAAVISAYAIYQFVTNSPNVWHFTKPIGYMKRGGGTFINPNHLAGFLGMLLPVGLAYMLMGRFSHVTRIVLGYVCLLILIGIGVTVSRGGWVATGLTLLIFLSLMLVSRSARLISGGMILLLLIVGGTFALRTEESHKRFAALKENQMADSRLFIWQATAKMWQDDPWTGVGPGHFDVRFRQYRPPVWQAQTRPIYAHNDYLNTLADWGIIGITFVLAALTCLVFGLVRTWPHVRRSPNDLQARRSNKAAFIFGAACGLLAMLFHAVVEFNLQIPANALLALTLIALISCYQRFSTERFWHTPNIVVKSLLTLVLVSGVAYLGAQSVRTFLEYRWLQAAKKATTENERIKAWKNAFQSEPNNFDTAYNIGESLRLQSWEGDNNYETLALEAMKWFERGMKLNPWEPLNFLRYGMCLDWIGRKKEATSFFEKAVKLDPNGYFMVAHMGWHYFQMDDFAEAKIWLERSLQIYPNYKNRNSIAWTYLQIVKQRLAESANAPKQ